MYRKFVHNFYACMDLRPSESFLYELWFLEVHVNQNISMSTARMEDVLAKQTGSCVVP